MEGRRSRIQMIRAERVLGYGSSQVEGSSERVLSSCPEGAATPGSSSGLMTARMRLYVPLTSCRPIRTVHHTTASDEMTSRPPPKRQECKKHA